MAKNKLSLWQQHKIKLAEKRLGHWEYLACIAEVLESNSFFEEYKSVNEFLKHETIYTRQRFGQIAQAIAVRARVSKVYDDELERNGTIKEAHFLAITKVPEAQQTEVFAKTLSRCEENKIPPRAGDFKKTARDVVASNGKPESKVDKKTVEPAAEAIPNKTKPPTLSELKSVCRQLTEQLMRSLDDMNNIRKSPQHGPIGKKVEGIYEGLKRW